MFIKDILLISIWGLAVAIVSSALLSKGKSAAGILLLIAHIIFFGVGLSLNQGWSSSISQEDSLIQDTTRFWIIVYFGITFYFTLKNKK